MTVLLDKEQDFLKILLNTFFSFLALVYTAKPETHFSILFQSLDGQKCLID